MHLGVSLVQNIGTDNTDTHSKLTNSFSGPLSTRPIDVELNKTGESIRMRNEAAKFFRSLRPSFLKRVFLVKKSIPLDC